MSYARMLRLPYLKQASSRAVALGLVGDDFFPLLDVGLFRVGREVRSLDYRHLKKLVVCHIGGGTLADWPEVVREKFGRNSRALHRANLKA